MYRLSGRIRSNALHFSSRSKELFDSKGNILPTLCDNNLLHEIYFSSFLASVIPSYPLLFFTSILQDFFSPLLLMLRVSCGVYII